MTVVRANRRGIIHLFTKIPPHILTTSFTSLTVIKGRC